MGFCGHHRSYQVLTMVPPSSAHYCLFILGDMRRQHRWCNVSTQLCSIKRHRDQHQHVQYYHGDEHQRAQLQRVCRRRWHECRCTRRQKCCCPSLARKSSSRRCLSRAPQRCGYISSGSSSGGSINSRGGSSSGNVNSTSTTVVLLQQ